jgi:uncharacterized protein with ParB-like and HNH nuclease domain
MIDKPISDILDNTDYQLINIPIFQRPYSWTKDQITQFVSDIENCLINKDQRHFYGLIVFVSNHENRKIIDVIDGQQRLTTVTILLSIIRDLLEDYNLNIQLEEEDHREINRIINRIDSMLSCDLTDYKVKLHSENESNFENEFIEIIQRSITNFSDKTKSPRKEYESMPLGSKDRFLVKKRYLYTYKNDARKTRHKTSFKNYIALYEFISDKLEKLGNAQDRYKFLINLFKRIINDFRVIPFHVESYDRAFEYFEVLNDRGLDVSALDLIKNRCLQIDGINAIQREAIFNSWSKVFSNTLDHTYNLIQFVRYAYMSEFGHINNKKIYEKYRILLDPMSFNDVIDYLEGPLLIRSTIFKDFQSTTTSLDAKIHNSLELLKSTKTVQWYSVAMAALMPVYEGISLQSSTKKLIVQILETLHEIMLTLNFVEKVANDIEKKLPEIASQIKYNNESEFVDAINNAQSKLSILKIEQSLRFSDIDFSDPSDWVRNFEKNNDLGNMFVFFFLYKKMANSTVHLHISSLEHTLPQSPTIEKWPIIENSTEDEIKRHVYSLGNFFVTHSRDNTSYGNKSFDKKSDLYNRDNIFDIIDVNSTLNYKSVSSWTYETILEREKVIIELFKEFQV